MTSTPTYSVEVEAEEDEDKRALFLELVDITGAIEGFYLDREPYHVEVALKRIGEIVQELAYLEGKEWTFLH